MISIKAQLSSLIQLANIDDDYDGDEKGLILMLAKVNGITKEEIEDLLKNPEPLPPLTTITDDERFEYLYNLVQLMKIDQEIFTSELDFCKSMAVKLEFKPKVISFLSSRIYSDPSITGNREALKREALKYKVDY